MLNTLLNDKHPIIAITGGIGAGKSVVSNILRVMGHDVYDCDTGCRRIMDTDLGMKLEIAQEIGESCLNEDMSLNRPEIARLVFGNHSLLNRLNRISHEAVRQDIRCRASLTSGVLFVETAIPYESGIDRMACQVWEIIAPEELRISRVMMRNSFSREKVMARISAQSRSAHYRRHHDVKQIVNDGITPVLPRLEELLHGIDVIV